MQPEYGVSALKSIRNHIQCSREWIDNGRARDTVLWTNIRAPRIRNWVGGGSHCGAVRFVQQSGMPQWRSTGIRVERIHAVMLCGNENHVVRLARYLRLDI